MKILILSQYFPPEFGACAARNSEHAALWAQAGHDVEVCTGFPNYPSGIIPEIYRGRLFAQERHDGYVVNRSWIYATPNRQVWKRSLASVSFMVSAFVCGVFKCKRPDVIIGSSGPFFVGPLGYLVGRIRRVPFVFEVRDILPQQAIDVGMIKNQFLIKALQAVEEFLYRRACGIITVAEASRRSIIDRGFDDKKLFTIENGIRENVFKPCEREGEIREEYGWQGKFVAMYIGAHGVSQGLLTLVDVAERLRDRQDIQFVFVGDGADKPGMLDRVRERSLTNVDFLPLQDRQRIPLFYAASDVCLVPLRKGNYFRINIPSKIFEIMACGRPIILGAEGQALDIMEVSGGGLSVEPENVNAYVDAILRLRSDPDLAQSLGQKGREFVLQHFTRLQKATRYIEILRQLVRSPSA
ncbi:MAG: glycosyltransferase family 4 protein [Phycisphaerae bacterium]|nr:glycosyltransferase family 4 protein [Phycisphaerae bacterium]